MNISPKLTKLTPIIFINDEFTICSAIKLYANPTNKIEIKQAVEAMFDVKVESVNVMNIKPKTKRVGRYEGKTNRRRKAIVKLAEGSTINYFGEE